MLYYSNAILSKSLPDLGPYVSVGITVVNVVMTIPPIFLIEVCYLTLFDVHPFTSVSSASAGSASSTAPPSPSSSLSSASAPA